MTDTSLDDFFAKKDKSKRKNKAALTTGTVVATATTTAAVATASEQPTTKKTVVGAANEENNATKSGEKDQRPSGGGQGGTASVGTDRPTTAEQKPTKGKPEEDEWREIEEEAKDYSGLKIQNLQISDLRDEEQERIRSEEYCDDGEQQKFKEGSGPWNRTGLVTVAAQAQPPPPPPPVVEVSVMRAEEEEVVDEPKATSRAYVPPAMRSGGAASFPSGGSSASSKSRGRKGASEIAPELDSEEHFPSLSAATDVRPVRKGDVSPVDVGFEAVKRGPRAAVVDDPNSRGPKLTLGNKFDALSRGGNS